MDFEPFQHHFWTFKIFELSVLISHFLVTFLFFWSTRNTQKNLAKMIMSILYTEWGIFKEGGHFGKKMRGHFGKKLRGHFGKK